MRNLIWGSLLVILGLFLLLDNLGIAEFGDLLHDYWPLLLILWGAFILFGRKKPSRESTPGSGPLPSQKPQVDSSQFSQSDLIHQSNMFDDIRLQITSQNFKGGSVSTFFGDSYIDLTGASIAEGSHELRVHGVFGNTRILLPRDTAVLTSGSVFMGSLRIYQQRRSGIINEIRVESPTFNQSSRRLLITISKVFGNAEVE